MRSVGGDIGPRRQQLHPITTGQLQWHAVIGFFIKRIRAVAGWPCDGYGTIFSTIMRRADIVADRLTFGFGQATEAPDIQIDPAHRVRGTLAGNQHHFAGNQAGIADHEAAGFHHHLRQVIAEMLRHGTHDGHAEIINFRHFRAVTHRIAATQIYHAELHARFLQIGEQHRNARNGAFIGGGLGLLAADMEGNAIGVEPHIAGLQHKVARHFQFAAEFARKRPFRAFILHQDAAIDPRAGRMARQLFQFLDTVEGEHGNTSLMRGSDGRHLLDGIAIGNRFRPRASGKAGLHFFEGRRIKAGAKLHQPFQDRRARISLHGIINARQGQCRTHGAVFFLDTIHIQHKAWRSRRVVAQKACDLRCHRSTLQAPEGPPVKAEAQG